MTSNSVSTTAATSKDAAHAAVSWLPLIILVLAQLQMGFNINALPVSIGPVSEDLNVPPTAIGTALVVYSLFVAAFVMLGIILSIRKIFSIPAPNLPAYNKKTPVFSHRGFFGRIRQVLSVLLRQIRNRSATWHRHTTGCPGRSRSRRPCSRSSPLPGRERRPGPG